MDIIEGGPHLPLTTSTLARQCHVSVRTLQEGFQRHLGMMSPMAYVRVVRLRRAQRDLRSADPFHSTVSAIAHRWGSLTSAALSAAGETDPGAAPGGQNSDAVDTLRRCAQNDVRPNTAASPARCTLISTKPKHFR
jgi:transcriptional regulator GlxA family with amidase domain